MLACILFDKYTTCFLELYSADTSLTLDISFIASASSIVSTLVELLLLVVFLASVWLVHPGLIVSRFVPRASTLESI
ncbi:TPA: hypothetical protein DEP21_02030 [Patescibacteria group bacterium]|nr:hypothetical protein [Candidatus Gracilibacteria bacterium]